MRLGGRGIWLGALGALILLVALVLGLTWLVLSTEWGTRQVWARVQTRLPAGIQVGAVGGRLRGPLEARDIVAQLDGGTVRVSRVRVEWELLPLLGRRLPITRLEVTDVQIDLVAPPAEADTVEASGPLPSLVLPVTVTLAEGTVRRILVIPPTEDAEDRRVDSVRVVGLSFRDRLELSGLTLAGPDGTLAVSGWVQPQGDYPFRVQAEAALILPEGLSLDGRATLSGDLRSTLVQATLTAPTTVELDLIVTDPRGDLRFEAELTVADADARQIREEWPEVRGGGRLLASGAPDSLEASGSFLVELPGMGPVDLEAVLLRRGATVDIQRLRAAARGAEIQGGGRIVLAEGEPDLDLALTWRDLRWPLEGAAQVLSPQGTVEVAGTPSAYRLTVDGIGSPAGGPSNRISLRGRGTRERLDLEDLRSPALGGSVQATGRVAWSPEVRWSLRVAAQDLDPAPLLPDSAQWHGRLDLRGSSQGTVGSRFTEGDVILDELRGTLRGENVAASASAEFRVPPSRPGAPAPLPRVSLRSLEADWGPNHVSASGTFSDTLDLALALSAPDLRVAVPGGQGQVEIQGRLTGPRASPHLRLALQGRGLAFGEGAVEALDLEADVDSRTGGVVAVEGAATGLAFRGEAVLDSLDVDLRGTPESHRVEARLLGPRGMASLGAQGGLQDRVWTGSAGTLDVSADPWGRWLLEDSVAVTLSQEAAGLERACWRSEGAGLCAEGAWRADGATTLEAAVRDLPLGRFEAFLPEGWTATGRLSADVSARVAEDRTLVARADAEVDSVRMGYPSRQGGREILASGVRMAAAVDEAGARAEVGMRVSAEGGADMAELQGRVALPELTALGLELPSQSVTGSLRASLTDFSAVEALMPQVEEVTAELTVDMEVAGTVARPELRGEARLANASMDVPRLGLAFRDVELVARGEGLEGLAVEGRLRSGTGVLHVTGTVPLAPTVASPARVRLQGESLLAADLPEVSLWVSPDLELTATPERIDVTGDVLVPRARVELNEVPAAAVPPSRDVVFVEDSASAGASGPAIYTSVRVILGDNVAFQGFGFSADPGGSILATDAPGRATTGTGELVLTGGRYRAYGQDLTMERGRILFAGGPIDNPGLDIRATRTAQDGVVAGLVIGGTLRTPEVTLFSDPDMMQSEVLAYIILGHPLGSASTSEGTRVANAAASLGLKGGNALASRIGQRFGLQDVRIEAEGPLEEAALVAGKYLSPRLYVSYGVGLFEPLNIFRMRYLLSSRWTLQAETGKAAGADLLYRIERGR